MKTWEVVRVYKSGERIHNISTRIDRYLSLTRIRSRWREEDGPSSLPFAPTAAPLPKGPGSSIAVTFDA